MTLLLHQIRVIIENTSLTEQEITNELEPIGDMFTKEVYSIKEIGQKRITWDDLGRTDM